MKAWTCRTRLCKPPREGGIGKVHIYASNASTGVILSTNRLPSPAVKFIRFAAPGEDATAPGKGRHG
jgi:hypothetical protein